MANQALLDHFSNMFNLCSVLSIILNRFKYTIARKLFFSTLFLKLLERYPTVHAKNGILNVLPILINFKVLFKKLQNLNSKSFRKIFYMDLECQISYGFLDVLHLDFFKLSERSEMCQNFIEYCRQSFLECKNLMKFKILKHFIKYFRIYYKDFEIMKF